ncbi:MAG TPA: GspH/FimT family pseudopilin [Syntrophorhabdaceae bacterium]|nr:GspH/FimT family pseudopilin [Syntrophorhabdaceae bacterium]
MAYLISLSKMILSSGKRQESKMHTRGFTLLEIIVVITLITLVLGLTTLFFGNALPGARLNASARELSATMRYARMLAKSNGEKQTVNIDLDSRSYAIEGTEAKTLPENVHIRVNDSVAGDVSTGKYPILFHESGAVEGGTITLSNSKRIINIELDPLIGSIIVK